MIEGRNGHLRYHLKMPRQRPGIGGIAYATARSRSLIAIAESLFELEEYAKHSPVRTLRIDLEESALKSIDVGSLSIAIRRLAEYVLLTEIRISFSPAEEKELSFDFEQERFKTDVCCLFSGGVDSLSGILNASRPNRSLAAVFCGHTHQARITHIVRQLHASHLARKAIVYAEIAAPTLTTTGYSQLRGALYLLSGAAFASGTASRRLIVAECGPTMYQPRFGGFDRVTMTTHPFVVARCLDIAKIIAGAAFQFDLPFEDRTKAEVAALCPEKRLLRQTHSCISQRFAKHDGTCYGCVIRRLAFIAAGIKDVTYARDPLSDAKANASNLIVALEFSANILKGPMGLPAYQRQMIDEFKKDDLFRRFALDNLAAIRALEVAGRRVVDSVCQVYEDAVAAIGSKQPFDDRLAVLHKLAA